jgi:hypothetical protein
MCSHYKSVKDANRLLQYFGVEQPLHVGAQAGGNPLSLQLF